MKLVKTIKTISNIIYVYKIDNNLFAFKPSEDVEKEILANKLAKLFLIKTLNIKPAEMNNKGILMPFLKEATLLTYYKKELDKRLLKQLRRIVLFDIWIGNKDRHTANVFVNEDLIAFDHDKVFQKGDARKFIKLDIGRKLNRDYVDIIERILDKNLKVKQVLKKLDFKEEDFIDIKDKDIKNIVKEKKLADFLISRKNFNIRF